MSFLFDQTDALIGGITSNTPFIKELIPVAQQGAVPEPRLETSLTCSPTRLAVSQSGTIQKGTTGAQDFSPLSHRIYPVRAPFEPTCLLRQCNK